MPLPPRLFKTKRFAVQAGKAWIGDDELLDAFTEMLRGQAESLGGGVWKKRLNANRHRSIVVAKGGITGFTSSSMRRRIKAISVRLIWSVFGKWRRPTKR